MSRAFLWDRKDRFDPCGLVSTVQGCGPFRRLTDNLKTGAIAGEVAMNDWTFAVTKQIQSVMDFYSCGGSFRKKSLRTVIEI